MKTTRIALGLALLAALFGSTRMLDAFARQMIYPAPGVAVPSPPPSPLEEVQLSPSTGERVTAWASGEDPALPPGRPVALFFHGNGENLATMHWAGTFEALDRLRIPYLAVDYPGYGRSSGAPSEEGLIATGDAAVAWARQRYPDRPVVVCGWSLGAAVALAAAARNPGDVAGVIALSPWTSLADVARVLFPGFMVKALLRERYDSLEAARKIGVPALVIHGERDDLIPAEQGRRIAEALSGARWVPVRRAGHNDLLGQAEVWDEISRFVSGF